MKIKKVEIAGFRAYSRKEDGIFDFTVGSEEPANFISIYAPNGFGKSSFYDAVEWNLTNNISRYTRDSLKSNHDLISKSLNQYGEKQHILRNRFISDAEPSYVKVSTTERDYRRDVRPAAAGKRDYTFDPKDTEQPHLSNIFLSQDAIDSFLKEEKSDSRYEKFMSNFGGEDEQYRLKLSALQKATLYELKRCDSIIKEIKENLQDPRHEDILEIVNDTIKNLNSEGEKINAITLEFDAQSHLNYKSIVAKNIQALELRIQSIKQSTELLEFCINNNPDFNRNNLLKLSLIERRRQLVLNDSALASIKKNNSILEKISAESDRLKERNLEMGLYQLDIERYLAELKKIALFNQQLDQLNDSINMSQSSEAELFEQLASVERNAMKIDASAAEIVKKISGAVAIYSDIDVLTGELEKQNEYFLEIENIAATKRLKIESHVRELSMLSLIELNESALTASDLSVLGFEGDKVVETLQLISQKKSLCYEIELLNREDIAHREQSNKFFELISIGQEILSKSKSDTCPLCSQEHGSFDHLMNKIVSNSYLSDKQRDLAERREKVNNSLRIVQQEIDVLISKLTEEKNAKKTEIEAIISHEKQVLEELLEQRIQVEAAIGELRAKLTAHRQSTSNLMFADYVAKCNSDLNKLMSEKRELEKDITKIQSELNQAKLKTEKYLVSKAGIVKALEGARSLELILNMELYFKNNSETGEYFDGFFEKKSAEIKEALEKLTTQTAELLYLTNIENEKIRSSLGIYDFEKLRSEIQKVDAELKEIEGQTIPFQSKLSFLLPGLDYQSDTDLIGPALDDLRATYQEKQARIERLSALWALVGEQLDHLLPHIEYKKQLNKLNYEVAKFEKYNLLMQQLREEFSIVQNRLDNRVKDFFYTELINKIYSKIDPHPTFKKVEFHVVFNDNEKPRLEVYLSDKEGKYISPNIYFSSAQLNILSLSIFLARALHVTHDNKPVETILIDDPIHSMDSINILSTIDLLRNISVRFNRQIILSTHDENFFELLKIKIPKEKYKSKFIRLESYGKVDMTMSQ